MSMENERQLMIDDIKTEAKLTRQFTGRDHFSHKVIAAMQQVPREAFVPPELRKNAFYNGPLPIGYDQTISQPYIVALMTDLLQLQPEHIILEIGTGSGYQSAILSLLCHRVYTIEVIPELGGKAKQQFKTMGYTNIITKIGNGYCGWSEYAPYDGIIVTAAAETITPEIIAQIKTGGRLVIPVGPAYGPQQLLLVEKDENDIIHERVILDVAFVPLV